MAATVLLNELDGLGGEGDLDPGVEVALKVRLRAVLHQIALGLPHPQQVSTTEVNSLVQYKSLLYTVLDKFHFFKKETHDF